MEFQQLEEGSISRLTVKAALADASVKLNTVHINMAQPFIVLQTVMRNSWTHPILLCMMQGSECDSQNGKFGIISYL